MSEMNETAYSGEDDSNHSVAKEGIENDWMRHVSHTLSAASLKCVIYGSLLYAFCYLFHVTHCLDFTYYLLRTLFIMILPLWDWRRLYHDSCLIDNPVFVSARISSYECHACEDLDDNIETYIYDSQKEHDIMRIQNVISEKVLERQVPVIVRSTRCTFLDWPLNDAAGNWSWFEELVASGGTCLFQSNIVSFRNPREMFQHLQQENATVQFYAHWENCASQLMKRVRLTYRRPRALPSSLELTQPSWLLVSANYQIRRNKFVIANYQIDIGAASKISVLAQMVGGMDFLISLRPKSHCESSCPSVLYAHGIHSGDLLVFPSRSWDMYYRTSDTLTKSKATHDPHSRRSPAFALNQESFTLAILLGGIY